MYVHPPVLSVPSLTAQHQSYDLFATTWLNQEPLYPPLPRFAHIFLSVSCLVLNTLNVIWFKAVRVSPPPHCRNPLPQYQAQPLTSVPPTDDRRYSEAV